MAKIDKQKVWKGILNVKSGGKKEALQVDFVIYLTFVSQLLGWIILA